MMAFETRYDVSTQVDSSSPTERLPAMCGSETFAIDVSSTSINVASVTVSAITQGLMVPSGILNLDSSLCLIALGFLAPFPEPYTFYVQLLYSLSLFPLTA